MIKIEEFIRKNWMLVIIIFVGIVLRYGEYIANRSLWFDEARVANALLNNSINELMQFRGAGNGLNIGYPIGFFLVEKVLIRFLGAS